MNIQLKRLLSSHSTHFFITLFMVIVSINAIASPAQTDFSCHEWAQCDAPIKSALIHGVIFLAEKDGIVIRKPAVYYVSRLESIIAAMKPDSARDTSLGALFHYTAAMIGDWDNGDDPLAHAKQFMGTNTFADFQHMHMSEYGHLILQSEKRIKEQLLEWIRAKTHSSKP